MNKRTTLSVHALSPEAINKLRVGPPSMTAEWRGMDLVDTQTNIILHQKFLRRIQVIIDKKNRMLTLVASKVQKEKISKFLASILHSTKVRLTRENLSITSLARHISYFPRVHAAATKIRLPSLQPPTRRRATGRLGKGALE